jgi:hypothetical protein
MLAWRDEEEGESDGRGLADGDKVSLSEDGEEDVVIACAAATKDRVDLACARRLLTRKG